KTSGIGFANRVTSSECHTFRTAPGCLLWWMMWPCQSRMRGRSHTAVSPYHKSRSASTRREQIGRSRTRCDCHKESAESWDIANDLGGVNQRMHFVYIVSCADGTLYTGYARDPRARERAHNSGRGAKYTAGRRPVRLVYQEAFRSMGKALAREYAVKQLSRAQKAALVGGARRRR